MARIYEEADVQTFHFPNAFIRKLYGTMPDRERAIILEVKGDSMEDDLQDGALVFIDRGPNGQGFDRGQIKDAAVYMVIPPGESGVTLKRVSIHEDLMILEASNRNRALYPLKHYKVKGLTVPRVVRGRVVGKVERF